MDPKILKGPIKGLVRDSKDRFIYVSSFNLGSTLVLVAYTNNHA